MTPCDNIKLLELLGEFRIETEEEIYKLQPHSELNKNGFMKLMYLQDLVRCCEKIADLLVYAVDGCVELED